MLPRCCWFRSPGGTILAITTAVSRRLSGSARGLDFDPPPERPRGTVRPHRRPRLHHHHRGVDCVADVPASHAPCASSRSGVCVDTSPRRMTPQPCARDAPSPASARFRWRPACLCTAEWLLLCPRPYVRAFAAAPPVSACRQADAAVPGAFVRLHALHLRLTTCTRSEEHTSELQSR